MAIFNSIIAGTSRKSAGNATFYQRLGTNCFRQKPVPKEGRSFSVNQLKQQKLYKFIKANIDAGFLKPFIDIVFDAKRKSGKGQTKMNMFYQNVMPQLVAQRDAIYELAEDELVNSEKFFGTGQESGGKFSKGSLGACAIATLTKTAATIPAAALDNYLAVANASLSPSDTPFTTANVFVAVVMSDAEGLGYVVAYPAKIAPTVSGSNYSIATTTLPWPENLTIATNIILIIGRAGEGTSLDTSQKYFCTDSVYFDVQGS